MLPASPQERARPLVLLQPGSTDPRRCWPVERFIAVGDALAADGALVAVNGTAQEAGLVRRIVGGMRHSALDLAGKLGLGGLCGVLERAALVVSNDTGPLHLALAIGTPAVGLFWHTNLVDGAPLRPGLLRAAVSAQVSCSVCGADNRSARCPHQESFLQDIPVDEVLALAFAQLQRRVAEEADAMS
jgi:ADP-heptose:LPS heptosyltransferase